MPKVTLPWAPHRPVFKKEPSGGGNPVFLYLGRKKEEGWCVGDKGAKEGRSEEGVLFCSEPRPADRAKVVKIQKVKHARQDEDQRALGTDRVAGGNLRHVRPHGPVQERQSETNFFFPT